MENSMSDSEKNRRDNDSRQSSEVDLALGQDEREFGAGGQTVQRPLSGDDRPDRETGRDPTVLGREPEPTASRH
jgi:hypothetical protein